MHSVKINIYLLASPTAEMAVSCKLPTIIVSTKFNDEVMKLCTVIGSANIKMVFKNALSLRTLLILSSSKSTVFNMPARKKKQMGCLAAHLLLFIYMPYAICIFYFNFIYSLIV